LGRSWVETSALLWRPGVPDEYHSRSQYPFLLRGEVLGPEDVVTRDTAEGGLKLAERVVKVVGDYL
jgi:HEPN domain-containing protein